MKNDKKRTLILLVILAIVVAAVVIILSNRPAAPKDETEATPTATETTAGPTAEPTPEPTPVPVTMESSAKTAWQQTGRTGRPDAVSYITYDNVEALGADASQVNPGAALVPSKATAFVFAPSIGKSLDDLVVVFVNEAGEVISSISYAEMQKLADNVFGPDAAYISASTYVLNLYLNAAENGTVAEGETADGTWYRFTAEQIDEMVK